MDDLIVVSAGAGAGKTYDICQTISSAIIGDEALDAVNPARILATTYTKKAAAELKGRLQDRLLNEASFVNAKDRQRAAEQLELAVIGTVHGVGHQLLTRYALHLGLSPHLQVLEEEGSTRCLHDLLSGMDATRLERLTIRAKKFSIDNPQSLVMELLAHKRSNHIDDSAVSTHLQQSLERLLEIMAPNGTLEDAPDFARLRLLAEAALRDIESKTDATKETKDGLQKLRQFHAIEEPKWQDFMTAGKLKAGKKSGADAALADLRQSTTTLLQNPKLHEDLRQFVQAVTRQMQELEAEYARYKTERGLLDFTDLEVLFLKLLRDESLADSLSLDFSLVVVDEFQDSNPIQLAIFKRLRTLADRSRWVGDHKQAIFGFRGTDPDLIQAVWNSTPVESRRNVRENRRSAKGIVEFVNAVFTPIFGPESAQLPVKPHEDFPVERWVFETKNKGQDFACLAQGIAELHVEGKAFRDIAILARTNSSLKDIGEALHGAGIPALLELAGLFSTREGALILSGLCLVADRRDSLAAATIMHLFEDPEHATPEWLIDRLREIRERATKEKPAEEEVTSFKPHMPWHEHPRLAKLEKLNIRTLSPSVVVQLVIDALDAGACIRQWGDVAKRAANLDAIVQLAKSYEDETLAMGSAATLYGLKSYLGGLAADGQDIRLTPHGLDAVTLLTYHRSKGLEWPVVVLTDLGEPREPDLWSPRVTGGSPLSDDPLTDRTLRYWPWPFGRNVGFGDKILKGSGLEDTVRETPEGLAEAERSLLESLRLLYVGCTRACNRLILAHRMDGAQWLAHAPEFDRLLPTDRNAGEYALDGSEAAYRLRKFGIPPEPEPQPASRSERWLATLAGKESKKPSYVERYWSPSAEVTAGEPSVTTQELAKNAIFPSKLPADKEDALGNAFHAYLAALPSLGTAPASRKKAVAERLLKSFAVEAYLPADAVVECGERFRNWVEATYPGAVWVTESPVSAPRLAGGQWSGTIDLLLLLPSGKAVIIDHKASPIRREHCVAKAASFHGQLRAYRESLETQSIALEDTWIHFPLVGMMARVFRSQS